jgi:hypothetical protein
MTSQGDVITDGESERRASSARSKRFKPIRHGIWRLKRQSERDADNDIEPRGGDTSRVLVEGLREVTFVVESSE